MLRSIFVLTIIAFGASYALQGAFGALLLCLWVAYFRPEAWVWNPGLVQALNLSFVAGFYLLVRAPTSDARFRFDLRVVLLFTFLGLSTVSMFLSQYSAYSMPYWEEFAKTIVITYLLSVLTTDVSRFRLVILVIAFSLGFEGAKQGWAQMILNPGGVNTNDLLMLGDNNGVAVGMVMLTTLFLALAQTATIPWERWLHRFFAVGVLYRAISTYSRGGFLACGALALMYILRSKRKAPALIGAVMVATIVLWVLPPTFWDRMSTIRVSEEAMQDAGDDSSLSRLHFWRVATVMANSNPILGVGHNAYNAAYDRYDFLDGFYGHGRSVHSSWLAIFAELGYTGLALYSSILMLAFVGCASVAGRARRGQLSMDYYYYGTALQCGFVAFFVGGSFVASQYQEILWHFIGLSMALRAAAMEASPALATPSVAVPAAPRPLPHFVPVHARRAQT